MVRKKLEAQVRVTLLEQAHQKINKRKRKSRHLKRKHLSNQVEFLVSLLNQKSKVLVVAVLAARQVLPLVALHRAVQAQAVAQKKK